MLARKATIDLSCAPARIAHLSANSSSDVAETAACFQVVLTNVRLDIPRHSWSPDFYTMSCGQVHVILPVAQAYVDKARPNVTR